MRRIRRVFLHHHERHSKSEWNQTVYPIYQVIMRSRIAMSYLRRDSGPILMAEWESCTALKRDAGETVLCGKSGIERPQQPRQSTKYGRGVSRPTNEARGRGTRVGSGSGKRDKDKYSQYGDDNDNDYEIGGANDDLINLGITTANPFWPTVREFQDMLLLESMWRINLVGR